jgi:V/A-type H+-transporting ATPase subunit C
MSTTGASNPEYVNARVRSRRAALLAEEDYQKLVRMGPSAIARYLEESEYEREINELGARHSGVNLVEFALNRNLARHFHDLLDWSNGELHDLLARHLRKYDAWNVKTVLRGVYADTSPEEIRTDFIRAGELDDQLLDQLAEAETIVEVIELLDGTIYHDPLAQALEQYEEEGILIPLENAVDREFYTNILEDLSVEPYSQGPMALYLEFLEAEIDFQNARNAIRLARSGADMDPTAYFIDDGRLFDAEELQSLVSDMDELVDHIRDSTYGEELSMALDELEDAESLIQFEHALDAALLEYTDHLSNRYPISITSVMSYILAKEREVENIRAIARGREAGLPEDEIERELVIL